MSIVKNLAQSTLETLALKLQLEEQKSGDQVYKILHSPLSPSPVGAARLFHGAGGEKMVYIGLSVPMIKLDSHMVFCFTGPDSQMPHFTVDAVHAGDHYAFHLDLIPRLDLAVNLDYMRRVYGGLDSVWSEAKAIEGLAPAQLSPLQLAVMSPWMLAHRASPAAMDAVGQVCGRYLDHWLALDRAEIQGIEDVLGQNRVQRDALHRAVLFNPTVDPVWKQVERLVGAETSEELRQLLLV